MTRTALILHGGGGPFTVAPIAQHLADRFEVLAPTLPGWNGTPRPEGDGIIEFAQGYLDQLERDELHDVVVIGSSLGGWVAAELALRDTAGRIGQLILIDAGGIEVPGEPMVDFFSLDPRGVAEHSWHDPEKFFVDPSTLPPERVAAQLGNLATMKAIAGDPYMHDPELYRNLGHLLTPTLVIWGDSDRVFPVGYGRAYAAAIPGARFELVKDAGHLPHLEQPVATFALIDAVIE